MKYSKNTKRVLCIFSMFVFAVLVFPATTFATAGGDPIAVVNNLSEFVFAIIRAIGIILIALALVNIGISLKSHDSSARANGFMTLAGGLIIAFTKEILTLITG